VLLLYGGGDHQYVFIGMLGMILGLVAIFDMGIL
jgi:hypothetical protein